MRNVGRSFLSVGSDVVIAAVCRREGFCLEVHLRGGILRAILMRLGEWDYELCTSRSYFGRESWCWPRLHRRTAVAEGRSEKWSWVPRVAVETGPVPGSGFATRVASHRQLHLLAVWRNPLISHSQLSHSLPPLAHATERRSKEHPLRPGASSSLPLSQPDLDPIPIAQIRVEEVAPFLREHPLGPTPPPLSVLTQTRLQKFFSDAPLPSNHHHSPSPEHNPFLFHFHPS